MRRHPAGLLLAVGLAVLPSSGVSAAEGGTLSGVVRLDGPTPARPALPVFKHAEICGESVPDDRLVVGPGGGLRYAVVTIEGVRGGNKPDRDVEHVLDNTHCRFEPHVQVAEVGHWLEITNSDPILHNADARLGSETLFNLALPPGRRVRRPLARPGRIAVTCDVRHTWMSAFVIVTEHPYHTVTDAYGAYEIRGVPPGRYTVSVWHEELGTRETPVTIEAGGTTTADVVYDGVKERP
jgi:carboxypeptidase family protein